jgi:urease accessory protein
VVALGLLIAGGVRMPVIAGMLVAGGFALFHGAAHGMEMPGGSSGALYAAGFVLSTAALHAAGLGAGLLMGRLPVPVLTRACGLAVAVAGVALIIR